MKKFISAVALVSIAMATSISAHGAEKSKAMAKSMSMEPTTEQRQKMATMHDSMATCLRSDKPMSDCKKEMMNSCEGTMGKECKMMHEMHGMKGHDMKGHDMKNHEMKEDEKSED